MDARVRVELRDYPPGMARVDVVGELEFDGVTTEFAPPAPGSMGPGETKITGELMRIRGTTQDGRECVVEITVRRTG